MPPVSTSTSVRIPDLPACFHDFELRVNRHLLRVTRSSEKWLSDSGLLDDEELRSLPGLKMGVLAAMSYPTCDMQQLRRVEDLLTVVFYSNTRLLKHPSLFLTDDQPRSADDFQWEGDALLHLCALSLPT
jgi:hypothetical protein